MTDQASPARLRKVATSVVLGTTIEWYDFMLYGAAAATVFAPLFFPTSSPAAGLLLSFSTFAVGFAARPVGGLVFGHFGDRVGRKQMLVLSLLLMGVATVLMGLIPTYESVGLWAPAMLVTLRLIQGFGVGGEWGGAVLTAIEHAPPEKKAFYGSLPQIGIPLGLMLSTVAFLAVSMLPEEQFMAWGWRLPFLLSAVLVLVGAYIRISVEESAEFQEVQKTAKTAKAPAWLAVRDYPKVIILAALATMGSSVYFYSVTTFSISYATSSGHLTRSQILVALMSGSVAMAIALPLFGKAAQRFGRQPMVKWGLVVLALWVFVVFGAISSGNEAFTVGAFIGHGVLFSISYAALSTFIAERFRPEVRFSASSITFQAGVLLSGAIAPLVATALVDATGTIWSVCVYAFIFAVLGVLATWALGGDPAPNAHHPHTPDVADDELPARM